MNNPDDAEIKQKRRVYDSEYKKTCVNFCIKYGQATVSRWTGINTRILRRW